MASIITIKCLKTIIRKKNVLNMYIIIIFYQINVEAHHEFEKTLRLCIRRWCYMSASSESVEGKVVVGWTSMIQVALLYNSSI